MEILPVIAVAVLGMLAGFAMGYLVAKSRGMAQVARLETTLDLERKTGEEKLGVIREAEEKLREAFKALSATALENNNQNFLLLAKATLEKFQTQATGDLEKREKAVEALVKPMQENLAKFQTQVEEMEKNRLTAYTGLHEHVKLLAQGNVKLQEETGRLVTALRTPTVRGRWGEMTLRRVVEIAEMVPHCDFVEQASVAGDDGLLRPDMVVKLPGGKSVVVDAKAPMMAYLQAVEEKDEEKKNALLADHARQMKDHITKLSAKSYWTQFEAAPEFVIMFLPGEAFYSSALEQDPALIELGVQQRVILATPTTLIALLHAVAYGWRQERIAESAEEISKLGADLYERLAVMTEHFTKLGTHLERATKSYNDTIGSLERNVLSAARRFPELGVPSKRMLPELEPAVSSVREIQAKELRTKLPADPGEHSREREPRL